MSSRPPAVTWPTRGRAFFRARNRLSGQWLRHLRFDRQRLGVDERLVVDKTCGRRDQAVLHSKQSAGRGRNCELRSLPARHQNSAQSAERRFAFVRAKLLPPLPARRTTRRTDRHLHQPRWVSLRCSGRERVMPPRRIDKRRRPPCAFGGTTLLAATAPGAPAKVVSFSVSMQWRG